MGADWLAFHPDPKTPDFKLPDGPVDAHCHVFGPLPVFSFAAERKYTPCNASKSQLFALRDHLGFSRNVIVQATCHGTDNSALSDACRKQTRWPAVSPASAPTSRAMPCPRCTRPVYVVFASTL